MRDLCFPVSTWSDGRKQAGNEVNRTDPTHELKDPSSPHGPFGSRRKVISPPELWGRISPTVRRVPLQD